MDQIALHSWTLGNPPLPKLIGIARRAGYDAIELNWEDLERCREQGVRLSEIAAQLGDSGLVIVAVGVKPDWLFADGDDEEVWNRFRRTADDALAIGCRTLMTALGPKYGGLALARENLHQALRLIETLGISSLAIEFNFGHPTFRAPDDVLELVRSVGNRNCGLVLDSYHLHRAGRLGIGLEDVRAVEILHVHFSDVPLAHKEGCDIPLDRLPPGSGQVDWGTFLGFLLDKGYKGPLSYEAPNPLVWQRDYDETAKEGLRAIRHFIEHARSERRSHRP